MSLATDKQLAEDLLGTSIDMVYVRNLEIRALRTQRDELLEALHEAHAFLDHYLPSDAPILLKVGTAIAKATSSTGSAS